MPSGLNSRKMPRPAHSGSGVCFVPKQLKITTGGQRIEKNSSIPITETAGRGCAWQVPAPFPLC